MKNKLSKPTDSSMVFTNDSHLKNAILTNTRVGSPVDTVFELDDNINNPGPGGDTLSEKKANQANMKAELKNDGLDNTPTAPTPKPY